MKDEEITFGAFLKSHRKKQEIPVRAMAEMVNISVGSYCDIESNRNYPPGRETLDKIIAALRMPDNDRKNIYDLAGKARSAAPPDLPEYINQFKVVRVALRVAKEKASEADWRKFINELEGKDGNICSN